MRPEESTVVQLVGRFALVRDGAETRLHDKAQRLVARLALARRPVDREPIAGTLWSETSTQQARGRLRSTLYELNKEAPDVVISTGAALTLAPDVEVDLDGIARRAQRLLNGDDETADPDLDPTPFTEDLLPDWYDSWLSTEREAHRQMRFHALEQIAREQLARRDFPAAMQACFMVLDAEPFRESAHRLLIEIHLAEGNPGEALRHLDRYERDLDAELGLTPTSRMRDLAERIAGGG
jgi:DNA-binding SARP family transcriptional activator